MWLDILTQVSEFLAPGFALYRITEDSGLPAWTAAFNAAMPKVTKEKK